MKKVCLIITIVLLITMISACSKENDSTQTTTTTQSQTQAQTTKATTQATTTTAETSETTPELELVTIKWLGTATSNYLDTAFPDDRVIKELEKRTGVRIDWSENVGVADPNQKIAVYLAAGDLPDVVMPVNAAELGVNMITAKAVIPLDELVEQYGPNLIQNCSKMIAFNKLSRSDDQNNLYCIAMGNKHSNLGQNGVSEAWVIRWDLYKELGYPDVTNYDEFLELMKAMLELEPENPDGRKNYGLGFFLAEGWGSLMIDRSMMFEQGYSNMGIYAIYVNTVTNKVEPRLTNPDSVFWRSMEFLNKAYRMGILDPESATLQYQTYLDKEATKRYVAAPCNWMAGGANRTLMQESEGDKGYMPILVEPNPNGVWSITNLEAGNQAVAYISTNCEVPERVVQLLDYCATEEGMHLLYNGVEGTDWEVQDGTPVIIGEYLESVINRENIIMESGINKYTWQLGVYSNPLNKNGYFNHFTMNTPGLPVNPIITDYKEHYDISFVQEKFVEFPKYTYDYGFQAAIITSPNTEPDQINNNVNNYVNSNIIKLIFLDDEAEFMESKDEAISKLKDMGADILVEYCANLYDEFNEKLESMIN